MGDIIYEKDYGTPDVRLSMEYLLRTDTNKRTALYYTEGYRLPSEVKTEEVVGVYCLKCREYHEYPLRKFQKKKTKLSCGCRKSFLAIETMNVNGKASARRSVGSILDSLPERLKISVHDGDRIHISAIGRNYYLNPKAMKPYTKAYQITVVINIASGQTYVMPAQYYGEKVFVDSTGVRTASFSHNLVRYGIDHEFFRRDKAAMKALEEAFKALVPSVKSRLETLEDVVHANYLKELYDLFPKADIVGYDPTEYAHKDMYKLLRRRYRKNPDTFPKYLYHGCSKVAKKSIRKILYRHPELKWSLGFLYRTLGITNTDILRMILTEKRDVIDGIACFFMDSKESLTQVRALADACRDSGMTDKEIAAFFVIKSDIMFFAPTHIRDTARMYSSGELSPEEIRESRNLREMHDKLVELEIRRRDQRQWELYSSEVSYDEPIYSLEGKCEDAVFTVIRRPWDLKALGKRFHNCVGSYMEDMRLHHSVIVEMTIDEKPAACIELDGDGKICRQAFAACNQPLEGCAEASFKEWTERHKITPGSMVPHANRFGAFDFDFMPF